MAGAESFGKFAVFVVAVAILASTVTGSWSFAGTAVALYLVLKFCNRLDRNTLDDEQKRRGA